MSSALARNKRAENDFYPTPSWCVRRLLEAWRPRLVGTILEPCAGSVSIIEAAQPMIPNNWLAVELTKSCRLEELYRKLGVEAILGQDCLTLGHRKGVLCESIECVWTNPPYLLAEEIILHHRNIYENADLVFLLRIGFLEAEKRKAFWRSLGMADVYVLPNRPSFNGNGTDSACYAWFVWRSFNLSCRSKGTIQILNYTSKEERALG